ncbi:MAG: DUF4160 domain-containing protein [Bdellovibrio sp.]
MVTILSEHHLKYKINDNDHNPPHVHVEGLGCAIRINLMTLEPMDAKTEFSKGTVNKIVTFVRENRQLFISEWERIHGED